MRVLLVLCLSQVVFAQSLALEEFKQTFKTEIESSQSYFETSCGYKLEQDYNYESLSKGTSEEDRRSVGGYCAAPLDSLSAICLKGDNYKKIVAEKVKKFSCNYLADGARSLDLKEGSMSWVFNYKTDQDSDNTTFISKKLLELL